MSTPEWAKGPCVAFDLETTGVDVHNDRIVQAAVVKIVPGEEPVTRTWLVDPGVEIPEGAAAVHGITTERAQAEATHTIGQMLFEVTGLLARAMGTLTPVVIMNAPFDLTMLEAENARYDEPTLASRVAPYPIGPIIDPFVLDKQVDKFRKGSRKLVDMAAVYGVALDQAHDAGADALAAGLIWPAIVAAHPAPFRGLTLGGLHQAQVGWRREQMTSLASYFRRKGDHESAASVNTEWPIQSAARPITTVETQGALL